MDFELSPKQKELQQRAKRFVDEEIRPYEKEWTWDYDDWDSPIVKELLRKIKEAGLANIRVPKEYGGQGLGHLEHYLVQVEFRKVWRTQLWFGLVVGTDPFPIMYEGTEYQKMKYLLPIIRGEKRFAFAFTEPSAGSDLRGINATAVKQGNKYVLNGRKIFITGAHVADFTLFCAYTDKAKGHRGLSMFYVDKGTPGFKIERLLTMFDRHGHEPLIKLDNCEVPEENLIGSGKGFAVGMTQFNTARLSNGAGALARAEVCLELAIDYAKNRQAFDKPIGAFQAIQRIIVDSKVGIETMRWLLYHTAWKWDRGEDARLDCAMTKYYCVETSLRIIDQCMQVFGGIGLTDDYPFFDYYSHMRMTKSAEGTFEILQHIMATELLGREITSLRR
jgi:alkylation response protein AidB-like acyl-CoA dehydrogenase